MAGLHCEKCFWHKQACVCDHCLAHLREVIEEMGSDQVTECPTCGAELVPDKESVKFGTNEWDGHAYKFPCGHIKAHVFVG